MRSLSILLIAALPILSADLNGIWLGKIPLKNGDSQDIAFKFTQSGSVLGGKMYGDYQSTPFSGTVSGDLVTFIVNVQEQAGNQINDTRLRFTGGMKDGELELVRERESSTNAGNGGLVQLKNNPKQIFRLKRLP
jgi:hypothetical protein